MTRIALVLVVALGVACARPQPEVGAQPAQAVDDSRPWGGDAAIDRSPDRTTRPCPLQGGMDGPVCEYQIDEFATIRPQEGDGIAVFGILQRESGALYIRGEHAQVAIDLARAEYVPEGDILARMLGRRGRVVGYYHDTPEGAVIEALSIGTVGNPPTGDEPPDR